MKSNLKICINPYCRYNARLRVGSVAQSVEQRIENPCVGGSIPPRATNNLGQPFSVGLYYFWRFPKQSGLSLHSA